MITEIRREKMLSQRKALGLSQQDAAYRSGISCSMYQRIEAGYNKPNPVTASRLIELLNLPADYFEAAQAG